MVKLSFLLVWKTLVLSNKRKERTIVNFVEENIQPEFFFKKLS